MAYQLTEQDRALAQQLAGKMASQYNQLSTPPKPQVGGLTGFLANAAPIVGGTLGAIGGSLLAPVAGTAAGGAAGAGLGAIIKQKLLGQDTNVGDIATESLLGALPGAGKLIKGIAGGAKAVKGAENIVQGAGSLANPLESAAVTTPSTLLQRAGQRLTEAGSGLKPEPTTGGINRLEQQSQFMSKYTGSPRQQRVAMEKDMGNLSSQVDNILAKNPTPIQGADVKAQVQQAISDPLKYAELDLTTPGAQRALSVHLDKFAASPDAKSLNDYIKQLNPIAIRAQGKIARGVNLTDKETAALAAKKAGDEVLTQIPEIQPLKQQMAQIFEVTPQVAKAGEKSIGMPMASGLNTKAPVQAAKGVQSKLGALLQGASATGRVNPSSLAAAFRPSNLLRQSAKQAVVQSLVPGTTPTTVSGQSQPSSDMSTNPADATQVTTTSSQGQGSFWSDPQAVQTAYTNALNAGDTKTATAIVDGYKLFGQQSMGPGYTKPTAQQYGLAQAGLSSLGQLQELISKDPSLITREATPGQGLPIIGGLVSNAVGTGEYNAVANNILDALARVRTGAAMTSQEESFYRNLLPKAGDDQSTIKAKLNALQQAFTPFMGYGGANNSPDLSNIVNQ